MNVAARPRPGLAYPVDIRATAYEASAAREMPVRVYQPAGVGPFPAVVYVHGGVWTAGNRCSDGHLNESLASNGIVVLAIEVGQPPEVVYPDDIAQVRLAIQWARSHAAEFASRADWVGGLGNSTGGHRLLLSVLASTCPGAGEPVGQPQPALAQLRCLVLCWPVTDPLARYRWARERGAERLVRGHRAYWPDEAAMNEGSPLRIVEASRAGLPPLLLIHGTADANIPAGAQEKFAGAYQAAGGHVELHGYEGMPHNFIKARPQAAESRQALEMMTDFIWRAALCPA
jgi:acetyl esterase